MQTILNLEETALLFQILLRILILRITFASKLKKAI